MALQLRRGTAAQWQTANPALAAGELGVETDTGRIKVGDGTSLWRVLPYTSASDVAPTAATGVKTANYTAAGGEFIPVDTTAGAVAVALPTAPPDKTQVGVKLVAGTNPVTVSAGGTDRFNLTGGAASITLALLRESAILQYKASTGLWYVVASDTPVSALDARFLTPAAASSTFRKVFAVADPTGVAATDTANILAKATAAAAAGGGIVKLQNCLVSGTMTPYKLNAVLPLLAGVIYEGEQPVATAIDTTPLVWMANAEWNYVGGTVLQGDGARSCFEQNVVNSASTTGLETSPINGAGILKVGLDNFTYGLRAGAQNVMGLVWSEIDELYIKNCSQWGVRLVNFQELSVGTIRTMLCQNGQFYGNNIPQANFYPGNSRFGELYNSTPRDGRDNLLCRGIVFDTASTSGSAIHNEIYVERVQSCAFNRTQRNVTATLTSGSTTVAVPDGTKFAVGLQVVAATSTGGYTAGRVYVVQSVSGNNITLGLGLTVAAVSASASTTISLQNLGYAVFEVTSQSAGAKTTNCRFLQLDLEGAATTAMYAENVTGSTFALADIPGNNLVTITGRSCNYSRFESMNAGPTDYDSTTAGTCWHYGARGATFGRSLRGAWFDVALGTTVFSLNGGSQGVNSGDIHARVNNLLYPQAGMMEKINTRDTSITLDGTQCGDIVFNGAAGQTFTLPTIVDVTSLPGSNLGLWMEIFNVSANSLTVATDGTQVFNRVAAKSTTTIAPGTSMKVVAVKDGASTLYWAARQTSLTLP